MAGGKKKRKGARPTRAPAKKSRFNASYVFIAVIVLGVAAVAVAQLLAGDPPVKCPPGQVWSDAHNHCH